ncbi:MAG: reductive dehalogenase domain-containing protein [Bacillota bacterium]|nr:reductive dehalogenase domain-containing protein [Bacillota bacterium]
MNYKLINHDILYNDEPLGLYPMHLFKKVDRPTNNIPGPVKKRSQLESASSLAKQGVYGEKIKKESVHVIEKYPIGAALFEVRNHIKKIKEVKNAVTPARAPIPSDPKVLSRHFKSLGYFLGADLMGVCRIPSYAMYLDDEFGNPLNVSFEYAIVFVLRKHLGTTLASSGFDWIFDSCSIQTYQLLAVWTETVANYIRRLGYEAEASNMRNYLNLMPPLLLEAGIGEISRMSLVVNPFFGGNFKSAAVLTNLPLYPEKPIDFGLQEYCSNCTICADKCPSGAISFGNKELFNGYETWKLDKEKCIRFSRLNKKGSVCGKCTRLCPWNRPDSQPHHFTSWDGDINEFYKSINKRADLLRKNNYIDPSEYTQKWWFDLEYIDGELVIPKTSLDKVKLVDRTN